MAQKVQVTSTADTQITHDFFAYIQYAVFTLGTLIAALGFFYVVGPK